MQSKLKLVDVNISHKNTLTAVIIQELLNPEKAEFADARKSIIRVLNFLEAYAIAAQTDPPVIDVKVAKDMYGFDIVYWYDFFSEFIEKSREERHEAAYEYLEKLRNTWKDFTQKHASDTSKTRISAPEKNEKVNP